MFVFDRRDEQEGVDEQPGGELKGAPCRPPPVGAPRQLWSPCDSAPSEGGPMGRTGPNRAEPAQWDHGKVIMAVSQTSIVTETRLFIDFTLNI